MNIINIFVGTMLAILGSNEFQYQPSWVKMLPHQALVNIAFICGSKSPRHPKVSFLGTQSRFKIHGKKMQQLLGYPCNYHNLTLLDTEEDKGKNV